MAGDEPPSLLERVIALAILIFGLVWAASVLGTPSAPAPVDDGPDLPPQPPHEEPPREEPPPPRGKPAPKQEEPRRGLVGGLLGSP